jgi:hypothetical protein
MGAVGNDAVAGPVGRYSTIPAGAKKPFKMGLAQARRTRARSVGALAFATPCLRRTATLDAIGIDVAGEILVEFVSGGKCLRSTFMYNSPQQPLNALLYLALRTLEGHLTLVAVRPNRLARFLGVSSRHTARQRAGRLGLRRPECCLEPVDGLRQQRCGVCKVEAQSFRQIGSLQHVGQFLAVLVLGETAHHQRYCLRAEPNYSGAYRLGESAVVKRLIVLPGTCRIVRVSNHVPELQLGVAIGH